MGRQRNGEIEETLGRLYELERGLGEARAAQRVRMLRLMKENSQQSLAEVATVLGQGYSTVERWWGEYRQGGMNRLLRIKSRGGNKASRLDLRQMKLLDDRVDRGELTTYAEIQQWLNEEFGISYSLEGVRHLMGARKKGIGKRGGRKLAKPSMASGNVALMSERFLQFLNTLPIAGDSVPWMREFQQLLVALFPDVDRVLVAFDRNCDLIHIGDAREAPVQVVISRHSRLGSKEERIIKIESQTSESRSTQNLETMRASGYPLQDFHPPHSFEFYYNSDYVGLIILFREIEQTPISQETLDMIQSLQSFLTFILVHLMMRTRYFNPHDPYFYDSLELLLKEVSLSHQQLRIVTHLLLGRSYKEIAEQLEIAEGTVKKQLNNIYQKTGTHSHNELFAKYFTPQLDE